MSLGMLFLLLSINPPAMTPTLPVSNAPRMAQLGAPVANSQPVPMPAASGMVLPPAMDGEVAIGEPSPEGLGFGESPFDGSCCGAGLPALSMAAPGCYGWYDDGCGSYGTSCCHGLWHCSHCDPATHIRCRAAWNLSPGDMYPSRPYFPVCHGHYYFRPYHFSDVWKQQQLAARWGGAPGSPYSSNDLFEQVYLEMGLPTTVAIESLPSPTRVKTKPSDHFRPIKSY